MNDTSEKLLKSSKPEDVAVQLSSKEIIDNGADPLEVYPPSPKHSEEVKVETPNAAPASPICDENAKEENVKAITIDINTTRESSEKSVEDSPKDEITSAKQEETNKIPIQTSPKTECEVNSEPAFAIESKDSDSNQLENEANVLDAPNGEIHSQEITVLEPTLPENEASTVKGTQPIPEVISSSNEVPFPSLSTSSNVTPAPIPQSSEEDISPSKKDSFQFNEEISSNIVHAPSDTASLLNNSGTSQEKIVSSLKDTLASNNTSEILPTLYKPQDTCSPAQSILPLESVEVSKLAKPSTELLGISKDITEVRSPSVLDDKSVEAVMDVEMTEIKVKSAAVNKPSEVEPTKAEAISESKQPPEKATNGEISKEEKPTKRRASEDVDSDSPLKKLFLEVEKNFPTHDLMINEYIHTATKNNVDEIQRHTEQLLSEIQTLRTLAQKKEHEWNNILHLKKVKEEILLRLLRRKQVLSFEKAAEINGADRTDPYDYLNPSKSLAIDKSDEISGLAIKQPTSNPPMSISPMIQSPMMPVTSHFNPMSGLPPPYDKPHLQNMPKPIFTQPIMMPGPMPGFPRDMNMNGLHTSFGMPMGRQGPTKDVKSIIADYRQRNPDITPRRGRRMKSVLNPNMMNPRPIAPKVDPMNSLTNLNMLFNNLDMNQKAMLERLQQMQANSMAGNLANGLSFKDVLVQYANMQQSSGLIPSRPPETISRMEQHHSRPDRRPSRPERSHEEVHVQPKQVERLASPSPRLPPPPPYPEISLLPVTTAAEASSSISQQNSLLHGILTKPAPAQGLSPTLARLLTSPDPAKHATLPAFGQAKNCGEITITPVQPTPPPDPPQDKPEEVVQLDDEESPVSEASGGASPAEGGGRLVIDEAGDAADEPEPDAADAAAADAPLCQGCRRRDAQFVCAGCANQWYCSRDCQVAAWDDHSEMCSG